MVVDVVLPAVLGLVLVREAGVEAWAVSWAAPWAPLAAPGAMRSSTGAAGSFAGPRWAAYRLFLQVSVWSLAGGQGGAHQ